MAEPALASETLTSQARAPLRVVGPAATSTTTQAQPPTTRLEVPPYELEAALALERELGIGHVLAQVLVRRGLSEAAAARAFLDAAEHHPPAAFTGIERSLTVIERQSAVGCFISIHGYYDVDVVCSTDV